MGADPRKAPAREKDDKRNGKQIAEVQNFLYDVVCVYGSIAIYGRKIMLTFTIPIRGILENNSYICENNFYNYEYNLAVSSTKCVEAFLFADSDTPSFRTYGENN